MIIKKKIFYGWWIVYAGVGIGALSSGLFHYGFSAFEGMKAYLDQNNNIRLFRHEDNMKRFQKSATRYRNDGIRVYSP